MSAAVRSPLVRLSPWIAPEIQELNEVIVMSTTLQSAPADERLHSAGIRELVAGVVSLLQTATEEVERDRETAKTFIAKASSLLQVEAGRNDAPDAGARTGGLAPRQVRRVKAFVEEHLAESIHVADLSEVVRLSTTHFSRSFRQSFGEAPHAYIVRRRLDLARHLMLTSDTALSELALACGFSDQAHLCKLFRKATGRTPGAWRRERRKAIEPIARSPTLPPAMMWDNEAIQGVVGLRRQTNGSYVS
jgi:AraC family transcriptional regulator